LLCKSGKCSGRFLRHARLENGLACRKCNGGSMLSEWLGGGLVLCRSYKFTSGVCQSCKCGGFLQ
jgi:hypothetical protein